MTNLASSRRVRPILERPQAGESADAALDLLAATLRGEAPRWPFRGSERNGAVVDTARRHQVHALVADAAECGRFDWPGHVRDSLRRLAVGEIAVEAVRHGEVEAVLADFRSAGVQPLLFKGAALAYTHYAQPHLRPRFDTDVLLPRNEIDLAVAALERRGYRRAPLTSGDLVMAQVDYCRTDGHGVTHVFDLHWKPVNPHALAEVIGWTDLAPASVPIPAVAGARVPRPVHALLLACIHRLAHHGRDERLIWLFDVHLLAGRMEPTDLEAFLDEARRRQVAAVAASGLAAAVRWFDTPLPPRFLERLHACAGAAGDEPSAVYAVSRPAKIDVLLSDLRTMRGWRDRVALIRQHVFPPAAYILRAYGTTRRGILPALYAHRLFTGTWKWIRRTA